MSSRRPAPSAARATPAQRLDAWQRRGEGDASIAALRDALRDAGLLTALPLAPLAGALARHTGGNPLFALEPLKQAVAGGSLRQGQLPLPASVAR